MEYYVKSVIPIIESNYDKFTTTEKTIADFFLFTIRKDGLFCKSYRRTFVYFKSNTDTICTKSVDITDTKNSFINMRRHL